MNLAKRERAELSELFTALGPDQPTLCGDWTTADLAAHLVLREQRMDAAAGILVPALESYTKSVQRKLAAKPFAELIAEFRDGPPWWSPWALPGLDRLGNSLEFFVHHEDVRRAQPSWSPRPPEQARYDALKEVLGKTGRMLYRKSQVSVRLQIESGKYIDVRSVAGTDRVTVSGTPDELIMHGFGRDEHARVEITGEPAAVALLAKAPRGI